uniref:Uncharacterized protein n=1 Tax=Rhizophora mucronata TaxID=61149 RepID=A0A2P2Q7M7_RHIMU
MHAKERYLSFYLQCLN